LSGSNFRAWHPGEGLSEKRKKAYVAVCPTSSEGRTKILSGFVIERSDNAKRMRRNRTRRKSRGGEGELFWGGQTQKMSILVFEAKQDRGKTGKKDRTFRTDLASCWCNKKKCK